jgi:hypothetical protein
MTTTTADLCCAADPIAGRCEHKGAHRESTVHAIPTVAALLLSLTVLSACDAPDPIPPPTEIGPRIEAVRDIVRRNESALAASSSAEGQLSVLEEALTEIARRYGRLSVESVQGLTETAALLAQEEHWDLAIPFMERSLALSREVYGLNHRETAYALHDVGYLLALNEPGKYLLRAELLFRGALRVRRAQAGADHPETAATEAQLAWQLLLGGAHESLAYRRGSMLREAEQLADHAHSVLAAIDDPSYYRTLSRILLETAFARGDYPAVEERAMALLADGDYEKGPGLYPDATGADLRARASQLRAGLRPERDDG